MISGPLICLVIGLTFGASKAHFNTYGVDGRMGGRTDEWTDARTSGRTDGWEDGWTDE